MKDAKGPDSPTLVIAAIGLSILLMVLMRFVPALGFLLTVLVCVGLLGYSLFGFSSLLLARRRNANQVRDDFGERVRERLLDCREREEAFRTEAQHITNSIRTLRDDLDRSDLVGETERTKAEELIQELEAEFGLRQAKAAFFAECAKKLEELLARHQLVRSMAARRKELEALRRTNFDDEATVEETRYHLEQDTIQLDTIVELTRSASLSSKAEQARELQERLEKLRTSL